MFVNSDRANAMQWYRAYEFRIYDRWNVQKIARFSGIMLLAIKGSRWVALTFMAAYALYYFVHSEPLSMITDESMTFWKMED